MPSEYMRLKVANVSGLFALFSNTKNQGPNFSWEWFVEHCVENADLWLQLSAVRGPKAGRERLNELARSYAREIAQRLVKEVAG